MNNTYFDIITAKEFEVLQDGKKVKKTKWNRVGHAWPSKNGDSLSFELYLLPSQRYVIKVQDRKEETPNDSVPF
ncbi:MAG: hypothetical protein KDD50_03460 [Bdellovibrionales bacterium]|nr:hypothetical protein [Bdellovibrionales bacterium]